MMINKRLTVIITFLTCLLLSACSNTWEIEIRSQERLIGEIKQENIAFFLELSKDDSDNLPLGQIFYSNGFTLIDKIHFIENEVETASFVWEEIAQTAEISAKGKIQIGKDTYQPDKINIAPSPLVSDIEYSIMDIPAIMAEFLNIPNLLNEGISPNLSGNADYGVMILLDGLQYEKLQGLINDGQLTFLDRDEEIIQGLTVYPPITTSATAAVLTGAPPEITGVFGYGQRATSSTTLFDLAADLNKKVIAVEGANLPFNLRNTNVILSGDRDGNGFSDDNVFKNSLEVINDEMPDLLYIHFHEIDDMGHSFGPDSLEYEAAIFRVDNYLSQIFQALPENTIIAIFADHGMHTEGTSGNHGALLADDLIIPILFIMK